MIRNCNYCNQKYEAELRYLKRGQGLYCGRACSAKANGLKNKKEKLPNILCSYCGKNIYRTPSRIRKFNFCDKQCADSAALSKDHPYSTGPSINLDSYCQVCKKKKANKTKICIECLEKIRLLIWLNGDLSVTRNKGITKEPKKFVKRYLIETRGDKCEVCGFDEKAPDGRSIIQMDHKDGNHLNNSIDNLQLLCPNHHAMTHNYGSLNKDSGRAHRRKNSI